MTEYEVRVLIENKNWVSGVYKTFDEAKERYNLYQPTCCQIIRHTKSIVAGYSLTKGKI